MDEFRSVFGWQFATVWVLLDLFGWGYCALVYNYFPKWKIKHKTAEWVVLGVFITIIGYAFAIGWKSYVLASDAIIALFLCFIATGGPMIFGYWVVDSRNDSQDEEKAKRLMKEQIKKAKELNNHE